MAFSIQRSIPFWVIPFVIFFSLGTVWLRLGVVRMSYNISQLEKRIQKKQQEKELLQLRWAELRSPKKLETLARKNFQLGPPQLHQVIYLKEEE